MSRTRPDDLAERLHGLVIDVPDFPAAGVVFRDITALLADAGALRDAVAAMAEPYADASVELVAGIESRGFILGGAIAQRLNAGFVPIRKHGKLPRRTVSAEYQLEYGQAVLEVHADAIVSGQRVMVTDDVLATGGTAAAACRLVEQLGGVLVGCSFLIELRDLEGATRLQNREYTAVIRY